MVGKGFAKYLRRSPMSDVEITQALQWIQQEISGILNGDEPVPLPDTLSIEAPAVGIVPPVYADNYRGAAAAIGVTLPHIEPFAPAGDYAALNAMTLTDDADSDDDLPGMWTHADLE